MRKSIFTLLFLILLSPALFAMARRPAEPSGESLQSPSERQPQAEALSLAGAYALALKRSEDLAIRRADVDQSWADFMAASGDAIGDLDFEILQSRQENIGSGGGGDAGATSNGLRSTRRTRQFTYSQPLFQGFKALGALSAAGSLREQRVQERIRAEQLLFLEVAHSFYVLERLKGDREITQKTAGLFEKRLQELTEWQEIGKSRESEVATARARMKQIEAELAREDGSYAVEKNVLAFLTGISLENVELTAEDPQETPDATEALGFIDERPDVRAAAEAYDVSRGNLIAAQSGLWPELSLDGHMYDKREGFQSDIDWDILFTVKVPIYKGGETFAKVKSAMIDQRKAKLTYEKSARLAESQMHKTHDAWIASIKELAALEDAVAAAEENYRLQKEDYEKKLVDNLDVLAALEMLNDNRLESNRALYERRVNYYAFKVAAGDCCESF